MMITITRIITLFILIFSCSPQKEQSVEILLSFKDFQLSKNEFIARSEFTIRPFHCSGDTEIDKAIALNSMLAELIFDHEAGDSSRLMKKKKFQKYLDGIKNQAVREELFNQEVWSKIIIDSQELFKRYEKSNKIFQVDYIFSNNKDEIKLCDEKLSNGISFDSVLSFFYEENIPEEKEISYGVYEDALENAIFKDTVRKDEVIGPIEASNGYYIMKINGWMEEVVLSPEQVKLKLADISQEMQIESAELKWEEYVKQQMKGKVIHFNDKIFYEVTEIMKPLYISDEEADSIEVPILAEYMEHGSARIDSFLLENKDKLFFEFDGKEWTLEKFVHEMWERPLIFQKKNIKSDEFPFYFQKAIADLVRDRVLSDIGLQKGYGEKSGVKKQVSMWKRYYNARFYIEEYLKEQNVDLDRIYQSKDFFDYLDPLFDSLKSKYQDEIQFNNQVLNDIKLTKIPFMARRKNAVYQQLVPPFPYTTHSNKLNYKRVIEKE